MKEATFSGENREEFSIVETMYKNGLAPGDTLIWRIK
jgi:hypothetical protein